MISRSLRNWGKPRVICSHCWRALGLRRRLTNKKRPWNKALILSCVCLLLRAKRRAVLFLDDGRPRGNRGLEWVKRRRSKPRQHLVYLSVHVSRPCWIGGRPLISMIGLSRDEDTFCLYAAPLLVKPRPIE